MEAFAEARRHHDVIRETERKAGNERTDLPAKPGNEPARREGKERDGERDERGEHGLLGEHRERGDDNDRERSSASSNRPERERCNEHHHRGGRHIGLPGQRLLREGWDRQHDGDSEGCLES